MPKMKVIAPSSVERCKVLALSEGNTLLVVSEVKFELVQLIPG